MLSVHLPVTGGVGPQHHHEVVAGVPEQTQVLRSAEPPVQDDALALDTVQGQQGDNLGERLAVHHRAVVHGEGQGRTVLGDGVDVAQYVRVLKRIGMAPARLGHLCGAVDVRAVYAYPRPVQASLPAPVEPCAAEPGARRLVKAAREQGGQPGVVKAQAGEQHLPGHTLLEAHGHVALPENRVHRVVHHGVRTLRPQRLAKKRVEPRGIAYAQRGGVQPGVHLVAVVNLLPEILRPFIRKVAAVIPVGV